MAEPRPVEHQEQTGHRDGSSHHLLPTPGRSIYEPVSPWPTLPLGATFAGLATSVAVDASDRVYVFNRGPTPMLIFEADGTFVAGWGTGDFDGPHGVSVDTDGNLWLVDVLGHFVQKRTPEGRILLTLGVRGKSGASSAGEYFNMPTDAVVHGPTGDVFVSDGYKNSFVHRFSAEGDHIATWGSLGSEPGEFYVPHSLALTEDRVVICDRENFRIQVFTFEGEFVAQWHSFRPSAICSSPLGPYLYLAELGPHDWNLGVDNLGCRVKVLDATGRSVLRVGRPEPGFEPDQFFAPHGIAVDSSGSVYVAEVTCAMLAFYGIAPPDPNPVSLRKWRLQCQDGEKIG